MKVEELDVVNGTFLTNQNYSEPLKTAMLMKRLLNRKAIQLMVAYLIVLFGLALITIAFFVPPMGTIDPTVLTAFGEILTFSGSLIGIDYHYRFKQQD